MRASQDFLQNGYCVVDFPMHHAYNAAAEAIHAFLAHSHVPLQDLTQYHHHVPEQDPRHENIHFGLSCLFREKEYLQNTFLENLDCFFCPLWVRI